MPEPRLRNSNPNYQLWSILVNKRLSRAWISLATLWWLALVCCAPTIAQWNVKDLEITSILTADPLTNKTPQKAMDDAHRFDSKKWQESTKDRDLMLEDLLATHELDGIRQEDLHKLLGNPLRRNDNLETYQVSPHFVHDSSETKCIQFVLFQERVYAFRVFRLGRTSSPMLWYRRSAK